MVNKFSYIGKEVVQSFNDNKGIFDLEDIYNLDQDNKWTNRAIGQLELIETKTISDDSSVSFTNLGSDYKTHLFLINNLHLDDNRDQNLRVEVGGTEQTGSTDYSRSFRSGFSNGSGFYDDKDDELDRLRLNAEHGGFDPETSNAYLYMYNALQTSKTIFSQFWTYQDKNNETAFRYGTGSYNKQHILSGVKFYPSTGLLISGTISIYGQRSF